MLKKLFVLAVIFPLAAMAAEEENPYDGKVMPKFDFTTDATPMAVVHQMLKMAGIRPGDLVIDLGCGDGRIPITAAKTFGARALGVDLNPDILVKARKNAVLNGVADSVRFLEEDIFKADIAGAAVVTAVIWPNIHVKLRPLLLEKLAPGSRVVTNLYGMGDWKADKVAHIRAHSQGEPHTFPVYLWVIPARIDGNWKLEAGGRIMDVALKRKYQYFTGIADKRHRIRNGRIEGTKVSFDIATDGKPRKYLGEVQADGTMRGDGWVAARIQ